MKVGLMELSYDSAINALSVKWSDELSVESAEFYQTVVALFATIQEKKVTNLLVDSGIPAGGLLTEDIINFFIQNIPTTPLKSIAILESPDYLWDSNLYQVIALLINTYQLSIALKLVSSHIEGIAWFANPIQAETSAKA